MGQGGVRMGGGGMSSGTSDFASLKYGGIQTDALSYGISIDLLISIFQSRRSQSSSFIFKS